MQRPTFPILCAAIFVANAPSQAASTNASANASASAPVKSSTRSSAQESASAKTPPKILTYAQLKKSLRIDARITLETVRANPDSYAGRAIEFGGTVTGTITQNGVRTCILNVDDSVVRLASAPGILNGGLLQTGASVRVLALVGASESAHADASSAVSLQPLAVMSAPADFKPNDALESASPIASSNGISDDAVSQLPPATDVPLVSGNATMPNIVRPNGTSSTGNGGASQRPAPTNRPPITEDDSYGTYDSLMPAYGAMVRRFNPKLTPDLVDKIALALLQAGHANGMDPRFLSAIISVESDFDIYCRSSSGAMGLGQLMPFNLKEANITNAWDPVQNVWGTARLLRGHLNDYRNRADGTLLAVAAYNAGPGAVRRAGYRVPNGSQVQRYVWKVYNRYKEFAPDMFAK